MTKHSVVTYNDNMAFRIHKFHLLLDLICLLTGLCFAREPESSGDTGAGWVVGVVIGSLVFVCIIIVIIVCCVCKKSVAKGIFIRPVETAERDAYGLNKSVYHVGHMHHHHHHDLQGGVHYDVNGHPIRPNEINMPSHTQNNGGSQNFQIPSISVSHHSPETSVNKTLISSDREAQG